MPKPPLQKDDAILEHQIIETLIAGLKEWRADLHYPQSHSDMQACVRGLLKMFDVKRKPIVGFLRLKCEFCEGLGYLILKVDGYSRDTKTCGECNGKGWKPGQ